MLTTSTREVARGWVVRLASGDITESQMQELHRWLAANPAHQEAFAFERANWHLLEPARDRLANVMRVPVAERSRRGWRPAIWISSGLLAVCAVLVLIIGNPLVRLRADYSTGVGEVSTVSLPDGSTAVLNTDTAIAVKFEKNERRLTLLRGEAWFDVQPDKSRPFRVHAGQAVAEAVGTAFSVIHDARITVRVTEGVVSCRTSGSTLHIRRGMQASCAEGASTARATEFDPAVDLAWRDRRLVIENQALDSALAYLNRFRRGHIMLLDRSHATSAVSATLAVDRLDSGLEGLASTQGLRVTYLTPYLAIVH